MCFNIEIVTILLIYYYNRIVMSSILAGVAEYIYPLSNVEDNSNNNSNSNNKSSEENSPRSSLYNTPRDGELSSHNSSETLKNDNNENNKNGDDGSGGGYIGTVKSYIGVSGEYIPTIGTEKIAAIGSVSGEYIQTIGTVSTDYIPSLESLYPTSIFGTLEASDDIPRKKSNSMHEWEKRSIEWESAMLKIRADTSRKEKIKNPKEKPLAGSIISKVPSVPTILGLNVNMIHLIVVLVLIMVGMVRKHNHHHH